MPQQSIVIVFAFQLCQNVPNQHCVPPKPQFLTMLIQVLGPSIVDAKLAIVSHIESMQTFRTTNFEWLVRHAGVNLEKLNETNE